MMIAMMSRAMFNSTSRLKTQYVLASLLLSAWLLLTPSQGSAKSFPAQEFVPISDIDDVFNFGNHPGLADNGVVVFRQGGGLGPTPKIVVGNGGPRTAITGAQTPFDDKAQEPSISDDGSHISFVGGVFPRTAIWVASESGVPGTYLYTKIADSGDVPEDFIACSSDGTHNGCDVNNAGTVAFSSVFNNTLQKTFYIGAGGKPTGVSNTYTASFHADPAINNGGIIAFRISSSNGPNVGADAIRLTSSPGQVTTIVDSESKYVDIGPLSFTDSNRVAFSAEIEGTNIRGVYLADMTGALTIADSSGPFDTFHDVAVNNFSQVAFRATLDVDQSAGVYRGAGPIRDKVIAPGDVLFGKVVRTAFIGRDAINDFGDIAMKVYFADDGELRHPAQIFRVHKLGKFDSLPPDVLDPHAQLSTGSGRGADLFTPVDSSDGFVGSGSLELSFDLDFLLPAGEVTVTFGAAELGRFDSSSSGRIKIPDIDPGSLFPPLPLPELPLTFSLRSRVGEPTTVQLDNISLINDAGTEFFQEDFAFGESGHFAPNWQINTKEGGLVTLNALGPGFRADFDSDGDVDRDDYELWKKTFGSVINLDADGSENRIIDAADYTVWRDSLGKTLVAGTTAPFRGQSVPEMSSMALLTIGLMFLWPFTRNGIRNIHSAPA